MLRARTCSACRITSPIPSLLTSRRSMPSLARWTRVIGILIFLAVGLCASRAHAYPWMIRHDHPGCVQCHMDPSGAGLLTAYGREEGENVLPMRYGTPPSDDVMARRATFAWGLLDTPDWLLLGGSLRPGL